MPSFHDILFWTLPVLKSRPPPHLVVGFQEEKIKKMGKVCLKADGQHCGPAA